MSEKSESLYFRDLGKYQTLSSEEEGELLRIIQQEKGGPVRDKAIRDLILGNLRFVISVARKFSNRGLTLGELINEGNLGLFKAAERFDREKDVKFISYAVWWIRQSIQKAIFEHVGSVRIPPNKLSLVSRFRKKLQENGGDYEATIAMDEFRGMEHDINEVMEKIIEVSLDSPIPGSGDGVDAVSTLLDVLGEDGGQEEEVENRERARIVGDILKSLPEREATILRMFYGLGSTQEATLDEIGHALHLTRERVRQIKNKTLRKLLRHKEYRDQLSALIKP